MLGLVALTAAILSGQSSSPDESCLIIGVVAREHLNLDRVPGPPLQASEDYMPDCDWAGLGLKPFGTRAQWPGGWLVIHRPSISGSRAEVSIDIMWATRAGERDNCSLTRDAGTWRLEKCQRTWAS